MHFIINKKGEKEACTRMGFISKTVGVDGAVLLICSTGSAHDFDRPEHLFVLLEGKPVPYEVRSMLVRASGDEAVIRLEGVDDILAARPLCGLGVYLPDSEWPEHLQGEQKAEDLGGFNAYDKLGTWIGTIEEILEYPGNPVFKIVREGKEILIPVADELIRDILPEEKSVFLDPPDGLLDLYL